MVFAVQTVNKAIGVKITVFCRHSDLCHLIHELIMAFAVIFKIADGNEFDAPLFCQLMQLRSTHHCAVVPHYLAAEPAFLKARKAAEIHCGFGMAFTFQNSVLFGKQREHVSRTPEILRLCIFIHAGHCGHGPFRGGDAGGSGYMVYGYGKCCFMVIGIVLDHLRYPEFPYILLGHGHAYEPFAVGGHEIDICGSGKFGGAYKVSLVFAVRIVRDKDDPSAL